MEHEGKPIEPVAACVTLAEAELSKQRCDTEKVKFHLHRAISLWDNHMIETRSCYDWRIQTSLCRYLLYSWYHYEDEKARDFLIRQPSVGALYQLQINPESPSLKYPIHFLPQNAYLVYYHKQEPKEAICFIPCGTEFVATGSETALEKLENEFKDSLNLENSVADNVKIFTVKGVALSQNFGALCSYLAVFDQKNATYTFASVIDRFGDRRRILAGSCVVRFANPVNYKVGETIELKGISFKIGKRISEKSYTLLRQDNHKYSLGKILAKLNKCHELEYATPSQWNFADALSVHDHSEPGLQPLSGCHQ